MNLKILNWVLNKYSRVKEPLAFELRGLVYNRQNGVTTMDRSDSVQFLGKTTDLLAQIPRKLFLVNTA